MLGGAGDEPLDDLGIDVGEAIGGFVDVVEAGRRADEVGTRVARGAQVAVRDPFDRRQRFGGDVVVAARPEPDDRDRRLFSHVPRATMDPVVGSHRPYLGLTVMSASSRKPWKSTNPADV